MIILPQPEHAVTALRGPGVATGEAPNLTIQDAAYLRATLEAYTSGARKSGIMQNIAA